jgi:DNA-directed RNA polymerase specialized sigma24 family protein
MTPERSHAIPEMYRRPLRRFEPKIELSILERLRDNDRSAIKDCLHTYGARVWALAKRFTGSRQEAEGAARDIFQDIWIYAARDHNDEDVDPVEDQIITQIAIRRLIKRQWKGRNIF